MRDLRCPGKRQAVAVDDDTIEIKCDSRVCGAVRGVVVLHRFNVKTGALVETKRFQEIRSK